MKEIMVRLNAADIKEFVEIVTTADVGVELIHGKTVLDGKSILGLFSMNFMEPICMRLFGDDLKVARAIERLNKYRIEE